MNVQKADKAGADALKKAAGYMDNISRKNKGIVAGLNEWIGPLGIAIGFSFKFLVGLKAVLAASQLIGRSLEVWSRVEYYTPSFARMLGGMAQAKARLNELARMAARGPFKFDSLVEANRRLQLLTRGAYAGRKAMAVVTDAAAASGRDPAEVASAIGEAMQAIARHEGVDGAVDALGQMGLVSAAAADGLRNLARSGAGEEQMLNALEQALGRNKGAAKALEDTLVGLSQRMAGAEEGVMGDVGGLFSEGKAAGMRAGLTMIKAFGPVLVDLMRPLAAVYNLWNKMLERLAKVVAWEPVKVAIKTLIAWLTSLSVAFAMHGIAIAIRDILQLSGVLTKAGAVLARSASGMRVVGMAAAMLGRAFRAALGPIGLVALALTGVAELAGAFNSHGGPMGDAIAKNARDIQESNNEVKTALASAVGGGVGAKADVMSKAGDALLEATRARQAAGGKYAQASGFGGFAGNVLNGMAMGAMMGGRGGWMGARVGAVWGGVAGVGMSIGQKINARNEFIASQKNEQEASRNMDEAYKLSAVTPAGFMNDPDYARAKAEAEDKMVAISEELGKVMQRADSPEKNREIERLNKEFAKVANGVQPEALERAFNQRMSEAGTQAQVLRATGAASGDQSKLMEADRLEARMRGEALAKELKLKFPELAANGKADKMGRAAELTSLSEAMMSRGNVFASGRASVGGAMGEAAGGVPPEFRAVIDEIRKIQDELAAQTIGQDQLRVQKQLKE